ncbi:unnamed protein product, partial [Oncorhynchus mykiss]
ILQGSDSAPSALPCTKAEVAVLLLGCCPPTASSTLELDKYVQGLQSSLQTAELVNLETEIRPYLSMWYEESVMHIHRVVQMVQGSISFLLYAVSHL